MPVSQGSTLGFDRYAFVANNPLKYVDPSGHCWGVASAIRGIPTYDTTCDNLDMALSIVQHPNTSRRDKALAGGYILSEGLAHGALVAGTGMLACSAVAACAATVEAALGIGTTIDVSSRLGQNVWGLSPLDRGWAIENALGRSPQLVRNFPTIDRFNKGIIGSIKSIDLGAKTYQNIQSLTKKVQGYITQLAQFNGASYGGSRITANMITGRELILAIPPNASSAQMIALRQLAAAAANQGVKLILKVVK